MIQFRIAEIGAAKIRFGQLCLPEGSAGQSDALKGSFPQVGMIEVGSRQIAAIEECSAQINPPERAPDQIEIAQVRLAALGAVRGGPDTMLLQNRGQVFRNA